MSKQTDKYGKNMKSHSKNIDINNELFDWKKAWL